MATRPVRSVRSASYNKLFPAGVDAAVPGKLLRALPWLCVVEAYGLILYNLAEGAHMMFPLMKPSAEFLEAIKIPSVGTLYSVM